MEQSELPEGDNFQLFPDGISNQLRKRLDPDQLVQFYFSCLQSKSLCEVVPDDFILDALVKHRSQLSTPHRGLSKETLEKLKQRGREFGRIVKRFYKPNDGFYPTNKATFSYPRNKGGIKGDLVDNNRLTSKGKYEVDGDERPEPFVIGLFGQPGSGKSTRINSIINTFSGLFPKCSRCELVYQRTCNVDHWDGYIGQPIVVLDDIGQGQQGKDIQEFQTLVSTNPYVLPMADLKDKGTKFSSSIIICTSNIPFGMDLNQVYESSPIIDDCSFWRRFHIPLYVEAGVLYKLKEEPQWIRQETLIKKCYLPTSDSRGRPIAVQSFKTKPVFRKDKRGHYTVSEVWEEFPNQNRFDIFSYLLPIYKDRFNLHSQFSSIWSQQVIEKHASTTGIDDWVIESFQDVPTDILNELYSLESSVVSRQIEFPAFPPSGPLPVRVEPIVEPLKVRNITAGIGDTFCLKPLQRAMWLALGEEQQFILTHGTHHLESAIRRVYLSDPDSVWISGDYSAATDSFDPEGSAALLEGILESIDHLPTQRWALKEISPHLLVYPKNSGLEPVLQKSGQLMGSFLSFPLLCLLNDCTARFSGLSPNQYLINGDDILMRAPPATYPKWKEVVRDFGLDLSLGKNYISPRFGTVNSQLIIEDTVVFSGKQKILDRRAQILGECLRDLETQLIDREPDEVHTLFKVINRRKLIHTCRDIDVPFSHGGLSLRWGKISSKSTKTQRLAKLCYISDLLQKLKSPRGYLSIPYLSNEKLKSSDLMQETDCFDSPITAEDFYEEEFQPKYFIPQVLNRVKGNSTLRAILQNPEMDIRSLPALNFIKTLQIPYSGNDLSEIQLQVDRFFLDHFLRYGLDFSYDEYFEGFLASCGKRENSKELHRNFLVRVEDLKVSEDFLRHINLNFDVEKFCKKQFFEKLDPHFQSPEFYDLSSFSENYRDLSREFMEGMDDHWNSIPTRLLFGDI